MTIETVALPVALAASVVLILVLPLARHRRRTGTWAVVVRQSSGAVESLVRAFTLGLFVAVAAWAVLVPGVGPARLGAWPVPAALPWISLAVMAAGLALVIAAQAQMGSSWRIGIDDAPTSLVTSGLFRWVRHPIYSGILLLCCGIALLTPAPWTIAGAVLAYLLLAIQARLEEQHLAAQHGPAYQRWAARVGRFVPGIGRVREATT